MVSAGNSGAVMAGAIFVLGRPEGVERPAIISVLPALEGASILLDMGAVVDCKPIHLVQFALMGEVYARRVVGVARPKVAILANGEEESKGTDLTRVAAAALAPRAHRVRGVLRGARSPHRRDRCHRHRRLHRQRALKTMEGTAKVVGEYLKRALRSTAVSTLGGLLSKAALDGMKKRLDWREVGGAPLVGVNGVGFISHGRSDSVAIENAIRRARDAARTHFVDEIAPRSPRRGAPRARRRSRREAVPPPRRASSHDA